MKIKKNDTILIKIGKDTGKKGKISKVFPKLGKITITGLNKYKKNIKPSKKHPHGGIVDIDAPIRAENVLLICPNCSKSTKVKYKILNNIKTRICAKCAQSLDTKE